MMRFLSGISIGRKIIGLVAILLSIMLVIAVINEISARRQTNETTDLTNHLVPITLALNNIEILLLEQEIHLERSLRYLGGFQHEAGVEPELEQFEALGKRVDAELKAAAQAIAHSLEVVKLKEDAIALARTEPILPQLEATHQRYHDLAIQISKAAQSGDMATAKAIEPKLLEVEKDMNQTLAGLITRSQAFVNQQATMVATHEAERATLARDNLLITIGAFLLGILLAVLITQRLVAPIHQLTHSARMVADGNLDVELAQSTRDEIGQLALAFKDMIIGLKEKENIKQTFSTYVDPRIVRHLMAPGNLDREGDRRDMTVFFSDIAGFTSISEQLTPQSLVRLINRYLATMASAIAIEEGVIDKFIGDAVMAYWGPPFVTVEESPIRAIRASFEMFRLLEEFQREIPEITGLRTGAPSVDMRIGIASGPALIGNMGSANMKNYTIMGDTVNLAARMEGACKEYGIRFLISDTTHEQVDKQIVARQIDLLAVKGKTEPTLVFEPLRMAGEQDPVLERHLGVFQQGLEAYRTRDWNRAEEAFRAYLADNTSDGPSQVYLDRIAHLRENPPGEGWDGVWRMSTK